MLGLYVIGSGVLLSIGLFYNMRCTGAITPRYRTKRAHMIRDAVEDLENKYRTRFNKLPSNKPSQELLLLRAARRSGVVPEKEYKSKKVDALLSVRAYMEKLLKDIGKDKDEIRSFFVSFDKRLGWKLFDFTLEDRLN